MGFYAKFNNYGTNLDRLSTFKLTKNRFKNEGTKLWSYNYLAPALSGYASNVYVTDLEVKAG